jgi:hypothetical protein
VCNLTDVEELPNESLGWLIQMSMSVDRACICMLDATQVRCVHAMQTAQAIEAVDLICPVSNCQIAGTCKAPTSGASLQQMVAALAQALQQRPQQQQQQQRRLQLLPSRAQQGLRRQAFMVAAPPAAPLRQQAA